MSPAVDAAAFALPQGGVSEPIVTDTGAVIVKVLEKQSPTADELKTGRDAVKSELLNQQKQRFYGVLHDQGPRADEHQVQPAGHCAGGGVGSQASGLKALGQSLGARDSKAFLKPRA